MIPPRHYPAAWQPSGLVDLDRLEAQLLQLDEAWEASYRALRDAWEDDHGQGTTMRYSRKPVGEAADDRFRRVAHVRSGVLRAIRERRAAIPADQLRDLAPRPWLLRDGCFFPWHPDTDPDHGFGLYADCVVGEMRSYAARGKAGHDGQGTKAKPDKAGRMPWEAAMEILLRADGGWVEAAKLPRKARDCGHSLGINVECAIVMSGYQLEVDAHRRRGYVDAPDSRYRVLGECDPPVPCPGVVPSPPAIGGVPIIEHKRGRGRRAIPQLALDFG